MRMELPPRELRDRLAVAAPVGGPDEVEPDHQRERQKHEDREDVAREGEEHREGEHHEPVEHGKHPEAKLGVANRFVLLRGYLVGVPAPPAALARPLLAVAKLTLLTAFAGDRDWRAPEDRAGLLVADALALGALLAIPGGDERHPPRL